MPRAAGASEVAAPHAVAMPGGSQRRSLPVVLACSLAAHVVYLPFWLEATADRLNERGASLPSAWSPRFGLGWLRTWAGAIAAETGGRLSRGAVLAWLLVFPVGIPVIQRALNQEADARVLPEARALALPPSRTP